MKMAKMLKRQIPSAYGCSSKGEGQQAPKMTCDEKKLALLSRQEERGRTQLGKRDVRSLAKRGRGRAS